MTDTSDTELTVTVHGVFTVPELPGEHEFNSYDEAVNVAAVTLGLGARFTVERTNEVDAVEALVPDNQVQEPTVAASQPAPDPTPDPTPEVPDDTVPSDVAPVAPSAPSADLPNGGSADPVDETVVADAPGAGDGASDPAPVVTGDTTDPLTTPVVSTVADVPADASDVVLGSPQTPEAPVEDVPVDAPVDPAPWPADDSGSEDPTVTASGAPIDPTSTDPMASNVTLPDGTVAPIDTTNAIFDTPTPAVPPTDTPADDTSLTEPTSTTDS